MGLTAVVKVGKIVNLSDARYCAGMGVDMLGFRVIDTDPDYIDPKTYQEIRGWFTGPRTVAELQGIRSKAELEAIEAHYQPDLYEVDCAGLLLIDVHEKDVIVHDGASVIMKSLDTFRALGKRLTYLVVPSSTAPKDLEMLSAEFPVLVNVADDNPLFLLEQFPIKGFHLEGDNEEKPGLKDYDALANVLELLEE